MVVTRAELAGRKKVEACGIQKDALRNNLLQEFTTALEEGDRVICLRNPVIYFTGFGDGDHSCQTPQVVSKAYSGIEQRGESGGVGGVAPLEKFVGDATRAWGRFVGCVGKVPQDLLVGYQGEVASGEWWQVCWIRIGDWLRDGGEEAI